MREVRFVTYGCKANQYDTQVLREALLRRGWREQERAAELVVVNTCTVTAEAGRKARQLIRRITRERPGTRVCVTGCLAESEPEILRALPGVEWVLGHGEAQRPASFLRQLGEELDPEELGIPAGITGFTGHTRAFCKIQDGCDLACAFCIIPSVRGRSRSRPAPELAREVRALVEAGHVEVVLCGIHIGHWGRDLGLGLADLLRELVALEPRAAGGRPLDYRLRLSSIEATEVTPELVALMAEHPERIAPHLHMPLQAGDDDVLRRMNRWYTVAEYEAACERIRAALDEPCFTADVLVGFPGEEERHFEATAATIERIGFPRLHVFPFSARPGTAAAGLGPPPPPEVVRERRARLGDLAAELGERYRARLDGRRERVVPEGAVGLGGRYQRVRLDLEAFEGPPPPLVEVRLARVDRGPERPSELVGRPLEAAPAGVGQP